MAKGLMINKEKMGDYEIERGYASYRTIVEYGIRDIVLCNNIVDVDEGVYMHLYDENIIDDNTEIFQYYLCNISEFDKQWCKDCGLILSYSDILDCDVLCVDHFGTSWDYVLTDVKLFDDYDELEKYEKES